MNEKQKHPIREHAARDVPMTREYSKQLGVAVRENVKRILTKNYESIDEFIEEVYNAGKRWEISLSFVEYAPGANVEFSHYKSHEKVSFTEHEISLVKGMKEYDQRITDEGDILFLLPHHSHVHSPSFLILRVENIKRNYRRRQITEILEQYDTFITSTFHNVLAVNTDMSVTGLRNADSLNTFLRNHPPEWIRTHEKTYVVCMIDLNGFKNINDTYGHKLGDIALRVYARILQRILSRSSDALFRKGGDEFVIIADISSPGDQSMDPKERRKSNIEKANIIVKKIEDGPKNIDIHSLLERDIRIHLTDSQLETITSLSATIGASIMNGSKPWETVFEEADRRMLRMKDPGGTLNRMNRTLGSLPYIRGAHRKYLFFNILHSLRLIACSMIRRKGK